VSKDNRAPRTELGETNWTEEQRTEFLRRRRARNFLLLGALVGFCVILYAIALVKLHEHGQMW
jgi:hypothetical protein